MKTVIILIALFSTLLMTQVEAQNSITLKPLITFGKQGEKPGQFNQPTGITVSPNKAIYITDTGNHRIQKFDSKGQLLTFIGGFGWGKGQFQRPIDIFTLNGLNIFVADYENIRIERYDSDLNWITSIEPLESWEEKFKFGYPGSITTSIHGDLFILDRENKRVIKLNSMYQPEITFGDFDWGEGDLLRPMQCAISDDDQLYVTDQELGCIVIYDYYGNFLSNFGKKELIKPNGICVQNSKFIYVTDSGKNSLVIFDIKGRRLFEYGSRGKKMGAFNNIGDVACYENKIYVTDTDNHRVQIFQIDFQTD